MSIVFLIIIGAAAGFLATRFMKIEADLITTVVVGMAGALVGGFLLRGILSVLGLLSGLVGAVLGAMALIWLWQTYGPKK
ncbi:GlsB/YeaQ/YmgE family stress response membrane protein [Epibacterium ulvae]|uniref:GlsB/YeaQ/YmgE family stress response membrane protein n=1 Tax=Epibacterium ulvae TaxID=1156985 RepID=UPI001BFC454D|nr:GlsB/YeaQ/YmgE family stress response membrane protein [Epibacterium ulvae]MBT8153369.1 GlsB/YeaQ/YmgE family stress response membrane protein [Epibacterium ulvae]